MGKQSSIDPVDFVHDYGGEDEGKWLIEGTFTRNPPSLISVE